MGGKGSGRRPMLNESAVEDLLSLSSEILFSWLANPEVAIDRKIPVVAQIMIKRIPSKLEHSGIQGTQIVIVRPNEIKDENRESLSDMRQGVLGHSVQG